MAATQQARAVLANPNSSPELMRKTTKTPTPAQTIATAKNNLRNTDPNRRPTAPKVKKDRKVRAPSQSTQMQQEANKAGGGSMW